MKETAKNLIHDKDIREPLFERDYNLIEETMNEFRSKRIKKAGRRR